MSRLALIIGLAVAVGLTGARDVEAQEVWDLSMEDKANSLPGEGAAHFADLVREKTGDEVDITVHYGGALGFKNKDHLDAVATGALPMAQSLAGTFGGSEPVFLLSSLPFIVEDLDGARILYEVARPAYEEALADQNQKLLYATPFPPSGIWAKKPVLSTEDMEGLRIRTYDANGTMAFRNAGAAPLQISFSDVIPQLSTGNIDAVLTSADGGRSMKFWEFLSHFNAINYAFPLNITTVNLDEWNALSEENRTAVLEAAEETEKRDWEAVTTWTDRNYEALRENDVTIVEDIPTGFLGALSEAGQPVVQDWLEKTGETGEQILTEFESRASTD